MKHFTFDSRWDSIKAQLKQSYAQLTDDDLLFAEGKGEELLSRLEEKLNLSGKELRAKLDELYDDAGGIYTQAKAKVGEWTGDLREKAGAVAGDLREKASAVAGDLKKKATAAADEVKEQAHVAYDQAKERAVHLRDDGTEYVRQNPRKSLLMAVAAGFVAGLISRR